jgi:hypothetical protein
MKRLIWLAALAIWIGGGRAVLADATLAIEAGTSDPNAPQVTQVYLTHDKLRLEMAPSGATKPQEIIFRADLGKLWVLDPASQSFRVIDREQMKALGQQMQDAVKGLEAEIDKLPPDQRQRVEQLMMGEKPSSAETGVEFRKTDRHQTADGYDCIVYDYYSAGEKSGEAWLASWDKVGLDKDTFAVFDRFREFFGPAAGPSGLKRQLRADLANLSRLEGFPVVIRDTKGASVVSESRMKVVDRGPIPADRFEVPAGFTEKPLPGQSGK